LKLQKKKREYDWSKRLLPKQQDLLTKLPQLKQKE